MHAPTPGQPAHLSRGDRVELTTVPPGYARFRLAAGEHGTVELIDSLGTIHIRWDNGARCGIIVEHAGAIRTGDE